MGNLYLIMLRQFTRNLDNEDFEKYVAEVENLIQEEKIMRGLK